MGDPNLVSGNIRDGVTIFGTRGNVIEYKTPSVITDYGGTITGKDSIQGSSGQWEGGLISTRINASVSGCVDRWKITFWVKFNRMELY